MPAGHRTSVPGISSRSPSRPVGNFIVPAGIYWESVYFNPTFSEVLVNGVQIATNIGPVASGQVQSDTGGTFTNYYYFVPFTTAMNAGTAYTVTLRAPAGLDPVMGDFAVLGCWCCATAWARTGDAANGTTATPTADDHPHRRVRHLHLLHHQRQPPAGLGMTTGGADQWHAHEPLGSHFHGNLHGLEWLLRVPCLHDHPCTEHRSG